MKKYINISAIILVFTILLTGCTGTTTTDEDGNTRREFTINEKAIVNDAEIKINSVKRIDSDCFWEYEGECQSETLPDNDFFLIIDLTIENKGDEDLNVSSLLSFNLKNTDGEEGDLNIFLNTVNTQLDGSIMPGDLLKGQIAYDVSESDNYYFYFRDNLLSKDVRFTIDSSDIDITN